MNTPVPAKLVKLVGQQTIRSASPSVHALCEALLSRYGMAVQAVIFYGSCLRKGDDRNAIVDLYLLVDSYRAAYHGGVKAFLNKLLPPNVFYMELPFEKRIVRAKYAVLSLKDFERGTSRRWFHSYLWARFAQPAGLLFARNERVVERVHRAMARAVLTFIERVLPRTNECFSAEDLWRKGFLLSYRAELRAERPDKLGQLFETAAGYYDRVTQAAISGICFPVEILNHPEDVFYKASIAERARRLSRFAWGVRRFQGKWLSALRLLKGLFTFKGGLEYILWKIERHSQVGDCPNPHGKSHSFWGACMHLWRLYRQGAFR
jgi:hypothetical protein